MNDPDYDKLPYQTRYYHKLLKEADLLAYRAHKAINSDPPQPYVALRIKLTDSQRKHPDLPQRFKVLNSIPYMGAKGVFGKPVEGEGRNDYAQAVNVPADKLLSWAQAVRSYIEHKDPQAVELRRLDILRGAK